METSISEDGKSFVIDFSHNYEDFPEDANSLKVFKKRSYNKLLPVIKEVTDYIFSQSEEAIDLYASIRMAIYSKQYEALSDMLGDLKQLCTTVKDIIAQRIEEVYEDGDKDIQNAEVISSKKSNIELQFTAEHNKLIIRSSYMIKFIIPIIMQYLEDYCPTQKNNDSVILDCYSVVFKVNEEPGVDIKSKLFKIVSSRIKTTRYSDRPIWMLLSNMSYTPDVASNTFYRKIILDIIPKLDHNKNIISFIHVSLRWMIQFTFRFNYPVSYTPKSLVEAVDPNNDKITNLERLEFAVARTDESQAYLDRAKIYELILKCFKEQHITREQLKYYGDNITLNTFQMNLLFLFFCKRVGRYSIFYQLTFTEYLVLLISFKSWLKENNYPYLHKWITASFESGAIVPEQKIVNNRDFMNSLLDSKDFIYLVSEKYKYIRHSFANNNVLAKKISTLLVNTVAIIPSYEDFVKGAVEPTIVDGFTPTEKNIIADEVLRLVKQL